jgi:hydrogenase maturation protein HypF
MPGGDAAVKEPWRMGYAAMRGAGVDAATAMKLAGADLKQVRVLDQMIAREVNTPMTSSLGRLFDAVAAVVLQRRTVDYEAQAAIELEGIAVDEPDGLGYTFEISDASSAAGEAIEIRTGSMWKALLVDLNAGTSRAQISARFHAGVADAFARVAAAARVATGLSKVAMSGGCMHNRRLARLLRMRLEHEGFEVYQHVHVSPGDGGLSYGQAVVAAALLNRRA